MNIQKIINNLDLIKDLDEETLRKLSREGRDMYHPIQKAVHLMEGLIREFEYKRYLANRGIKNYLVLNEFFENVSKDYQSEDESDNFLSLLKEALIDVDEYLETIGSNQYYSSSTVFNLLLKRGATEGQLDEKLNKFLVEKEVIAPIYTYLCHRCGDGVLVLQDYPTEEELKEMVEEAYMCDNCQDFLTLDFKHVANSGFYKMTDKEN